MLFTIIASCLLVGSQAMTQTVIEPYAAVMNLDEIGLYRVGYAYRGKATVQMPFGWTGHFESATGISCTPFGQHNGRSSFLIHCPWRGGTGVTYQEFAFALPRVRRIFLRGATAMMSDIVGKSDGVVFRVYVNGKPVYRVQQKDAEWKPFRIDLSKLGGTTAHLRFETDPGPADNPGFDYSLWSGRALVLEGYKAPAQARALRPPLDVSRLTETRAQSVVPKSAFAGRTRVTVTPELARLSYVGPDGRFEYVWEPDGISLGRVRLSYAPPKGTPVVVPLASGNRIEWTAPPKLVRTSGFVRLPNGDGASLTNHMDVGGTTAVLTLEGRIVGKTLKLTARCDKGVIARLEAGDWGPVLLKRQVPVPYYGIVHYLRREDLFANTFLDWTSSSASRHEATAAVYDSLTDGRRNPLQETVLYSAARHLAEVLPFIPNPPSPYLREMGGRIVLDVWGGRYVDIAQKLETLHEFGIRKCLVLIHDWQRSGYDNALPAHIPAAQDKGGDEGMEMLVRTATRLGHWIALHENYVDYYPNYDLFDERHIALDPAGNRVLAWFNPGTKIQSFAIQPNAILTLAKTQSPEIHSRYGTNACYLDVHSAVPPWFHVDFRATEPGAGTFRQVFEAHRNLWAYERQTHGGPVLGEGNSHWYWSGLLDGVEAQFGTGWPVNAGQSAPLMVDFNLLKIHPLQLNHGQGYYERWWSDMPWGAVPTMAHLDQYRLQEILFGHIGFLGASAWDKTPYSWLEHHLVTPVTSRHAGVPVRSIEYYVGGKWVTATEAAIAGDWRRPRVVYANGLRVIGNGSADTWRVEGATLPPHGWIAHGAGVTAYTAVRDGVIVDYAETPDTVFANARAAPDWQLSSITLVRPTVARFEQTGPRLFQVTYRWEVGSTPAADYTCFVHFSAAVRDYYDEGIRFQQDHALPSPTSSWTPGATVADGPYTIRVPDGVPDGRYEWGIGLFTPDLGRVSILGPKDPGGRVVLGWIVIADGGRVIRFEPNTNRGNASGLASSQRLNGNGTVVTFASVKTDGSVFIERDGDKWVLRTMPRNRPFTVLLNPARFGTPDRVQCVHADTPYVQPVPTDGWWRLPLTGAREYRWPAVPGAARAAKVRVP